MSCLAVFGGLGVGSLLELRGISIPGHFCRYQCRGLLVAERPPRDDRRPGGPWGAPFRISAPIRFSDFLGTRTGGVRQRN